MARAGSTAAKDHAKKDQPEKANIQSDFSLGSVKSAYFLALARGPLPLYANTCSICEHLFYMRTLVLLWAGVPITLPDNARRRYVIVITNCHNEIDLIAAACNHLPSGQHGPPNIRGKKVNKLKQYLINAALIAGGTVTLLLAITALDLLADTAARIAAAIMALGFMALVAKLPNPTSGRHARGN